MTMIKRQGVLFVFFLIILTAAVSEGSWRNRKAPDFSLAGLSGQRVSLSDMRGKVVFIDFWATWCPPCKKEFPELKRLTAEFKDKAFVTLAVSEDKVRSNVYKFTSDYPDMPANLIVLLDKRSDAIKKYSVGAMPTSFIIDARGVIRYIHFGYKESDPETWRSEIKTLIK
ncbi:MAG: TlpA family protein disulfide reductase [Thermodesulfobacteriota bacterium]